MKLENNRVLRALVVVNRIVIAIAGVACFKSEHVAKTAHFALAETSKSRQENLAVDLHLIGS